MTICNPLLSLTQNFFFFLLALQQGYLLKGAMHFSWKVVSGASEYSSSHSNMKEYSLTQLC